MFAVCIIKQLLDGEFVVGFSVVVPIEGAIDLAIDDIRVGVAEGLPVKATVGILDGLAKRLLGVNEGILVGVAEDLKVGAAVGILDGLAEGLDGVNDGILVGVADGLPVGVKVGILDGLAVGLVGTNEGIFVGVAEGLPVGIMVGILDGFAEGLVGVNKGILVGVAEQPFNTLTGAGEMLSNAVVARTTPFSQHTNDKELQKSNAKSPELKNIGRLINERRLQPIYVIVEGIVIDCKEEGIGLSLTSAITNIAIPIPVRPLTRVIWVREVQAANAWSPINKIKS